MRFYVYIHRKQSDGTPFYVGKGKEGRAWCFKGRNQKWKNIANKHGTTVEILSDGLTETEAFNLEIETIKNLRQSGIDLANLTDGGEGSSGIIVSRETREKISKIHKGRQKSEQECLNMSKAQKGKKKKPESVEKMRKSLTGKKQSEETKRKRAESIIASGKRRDNNVYVFFTHDDVFIGTRRQLSDYSKIPVQSFRPLFQKNPHKYAHGWSVLKFNELIILKEIT